MRESKKEPTESTAGSLLLAHPALRDPNFSRTVVLMSAHDADGAMGVVLNRPLGRRLGEVNGDFALGALAGVPLFCGGPVEPKHVLLVGWQLHDDGFHLHFGLDVERATQLVGESGTQVRAFLGYSGWSAGQLEKELKQDTWVVADVPPELMRYPADTGLWRLVLGGQGENWRLFADEPEDTSQN